MSRGNGSSNSGWLRCMPGVNMSLNQVAGEGSVHTHYDAPLGARGLVCIVECCAPSPCYNHDGKSGRANCGCFRPDGGYIEGSRAAALAQGCGWCVLLPGKWLCPYHVDKYGIDQAGFTSLLQTLQTQDRVAQIRREGGIVLD